MSRIGLLNAGAAALSVALSMALGSPSAKPVPGPAIRAAGTPLPSLTRVHGRAAIMDASGHFVPVRDYRRIVPTSSLADDLLLALAAPDRIVAFTHNSASQAPSAYRYAGKPLLEGPADLERVIALRPDLVLTHGSVAGRDRIARMREAGLEVFDLGEMRGLSTLLPNIVAVATLLGRPETGSQLARRFGRRMHGVAFEIAQADRPRGIYLGIYGDGLYGASVGTSYHDVLTAGGIRDAAANQYQGWPRYTPEALLALDPELIVTHTGMTAALCAHVGLQELRACRTRRVIEIDGRLLADPGLSMLEAAETLFEAVHARGL